MGIKNIKSEKVRKHITQELCSDKVEQKNQQDAGHPEVHHVQLYTPPI